MQDPNYEWPVSDTGGVKMGGKEAARMLQVSYPQLYVLIERGELLRAEKRRHNMRKQPLIFFLSDVVRLAVRYRTLSEDEANTLLHPKSAAVVAA